MSSRNGGIKGVEKRDLFFPFNNKIKCTEQQAAIEAAGERFRYRLINVKHDAWEEGWTEIPVEAHKQHLTF